MKHWFEFPKPGNCQEFFLELEFFSPCDYGTIWNSWRIAEVDCPDDRLRLIKDLAAQYNGKEIPRP